MNLLDELDLLNALHLEGSCNSFNKMTLGEIR